MKLYGQHDGFGILKTGYTAGFAAAIFAAFIWYCDTGSSIGIKRRTPGCNHCRLPKDPTAITER